MAKVKITGHASGTGVVTVTAPNTSTDRTITLPDSTDTLIGSATTDALTTRVNGAGGRKNILFNGAMNVAQRGTSTTGITSGGYYTCDRWLFGSTIGTFTQTQSTDVPTGQGFATSMKLDCTTAEATIGAIDDNIILSQRVEGQNLQYLKYGTSNAESTIVSFWVKSSKTGTYVLEMYNSDSSRQVAKSYTIDSANTWEKKTITYAGDTTGTYTNDNNRSLDFNFWLGAGTFYSSGTLPSTWQNYANGDRAAGVVNLGDSTSNNFYITGVQFETGSVATDFEHRSYGEELALCQRYYWKAYQPYSLQGTRWSAEYFVSVEHPVVMRANPTLTISRAACWTVFASAVSQASTIVSTINVSSTQSIELAVTTPSVGVSAAVRLNAGTDWFALDSEL